MRETPTNTPLATMLLASVCCCALHSKFILRHNQQNHLHILADQLTVPVRRHLQLQLNVLRTLHRFDKMQHTLVTDGLEAEEALIDVLVQARHAVHDLKVEVELVVVAGPAEREQSTSVRRHRHIGGEHDEIVDVGQRTLEAGQIAAIA